MTNVERISRAGISAERTGQIPPVSQSDAQPDRGPHKKTNKKAGKFIAAAIAISTIAGAGLYANSRLNQGANPDNSPIPSMGGYLPGESQTPEPSIVIVSPSPEVTPPPSESATPSVEPTRTLPPPPPSPKETFSNIETVPLNKNGYVQIDNGGIYIYNGTVVAIDKNPDGTVKDFTITVPGNKITKKTDFSDISKYQGLSLKVNVDDEILWGVSTIKPPILIKGPEGFSKYISVGNSFGYLAFPIITLPDGGTYAGWNKYITLNKTIIKKINSSVGQHMSRSDSRFTLNAEGVIVEGTA